MKPTRTRSQNAIDMQVFMNAVRASIGLDPLYPRAGLRVMGANGRTHEVCVWDSWSNAYGRSGGSYELGLGCRQGNAHDGAGVN